MENLLKFPISRAHLVYNMLKKLTNLRQLRSLGNTIL